MKITRTMGKACLVALSRYSLKPGGWPDYQAFDFHTRAAMCELGWLDGEHLSFDDSTESIDVVALLLALIVAMSGNCSGVAKEER